MANEQAERDDNRVAALLVHDSTGNETRKLKLTSNNSLPTEQHSVGTLGHGSKAVATAGTDLPLSASSVPCKWVTLEAYRSNTGIIAFGGTGVDAAVAGTGNTLASADTATLYVSNLNVVYIDSTVSGEGVRYTYGV